ncbi:DUF3566 domain-containing protein [uncultured Phycicoccus sp.]|uniref:DUF3566 domain-containing protein n=1 Tax=uncultured Phycicoccus sp. TaxID=661422 RepID=UPI00262E71A8|nr:DUF3566 domain-containing protein [uncultured Phycicoccus sp.]
MSTADHAGRPVRSSTPPRRSPSQGADSGRSGSGSGPGREGGTVRREAAPSGPAPARDASQRTAALPAKGPAAGPVQEGPGGPVQRPAGAAGAPRRISARRVRLTVSRIDPWSAMKMSFLLSVALGIALVVMTVVLWTVLDAMGVFDQVNGVVGQVIQDDGQTFDILDFVGFTRVVSLSIVIGVVDVILFTAIATLAAFLYNVSSALVGGVSLTLTDD